MLLDCCYAAQAARYRDDRLIELLAASGVNKRTPPAGSYSFTSTIMRAMSRMLKQRECLTVRELYTRLSRQVEQDEKVYETPVHICLTGRDESITLRPRKQATELEETREDSTLALISITISLSQKPDRPALRRLQRWLKTATPRSILAITVDKILLQAEHIQDFLQQRGDPKLQAAIAKDLEARKQMQTLTLQTPSLEISESRSRGAEEVQAQAILESLKEWNDRVYQSLQSNLLLDPDFCSADKLQDLQLSASAKMLGLSDSARLSLLNTKLEECAEFQDVRALARASIILEDNTESSAIRNYGQMADKRVIVEYRGYVRANERGKAVLVIKRLAHLLKEARDPAFHIAAFVGFTDEPLHDRFGLVFQVPEGTPPKGPRHVSLNEAYNEPKRMDLKVRINIGIALTRALSALHAVRWVHKSLCSQHVIFFANSIRPGTENNPEDTDAQIDFTQPRLFGFGLSRPEDVSSIGTKEYRRSRQIYMHPKRWGRPEENFEKIHDIYALGVILLEIGCWRPASMLDKKGKKFEWVNDEEQVRKELIGVAKEMLPHMAGGMYCQAVLACLDDSFDEHARSGKDAAKMHKEFASRVLDVLVGAAHGL
jgi:hypothetical protein